MNRTYTASLHLAPGPERQLLLAALDAGPATGGYLAAHDARAWAAGGAAWQSSGSFRGALPRVGRQTVRAALVRHVALGLAAIVSIANRQHRRNASPSPSTALTTPSSSR